jgi:hypothetical protein
MRASAQVPVRRRAGPDHRILVSWRAVNVGDRMTSFKTIRARAEKRKGGPKALDELMPDKPDLKGLAKQGDDRILAEMTRRVFARASPGA